MKNEKRAAELLTLLSVRPLDEREARELREILRDSPEALDLYLDHCEMETWLAAAGEGVTDPQLEPVALSAATVVERRSPARVPWIAAAVVILAVIGLSFYPEKVEPEVVVEEPIQAPATEDMILASNDPEPVRDPWKVINSTGSVKHPSLSETAVPKSNTGKVRPIKFNRDVRPILSETCFHCHGPDEHGRRADLRLDSLAGATADLGGTQAIVPGDLKKSEAWWRIISDDEDELMPPPESHLVLTEEQKRTLRRWIEEGAEYEGHWAYQAPQKPVVPKTGSDWGRNEIDKFILARLEEEGMKPSGEADPRTLIRRLTFDLTGLPPTTEEVRTFAADYEKRGEDAWQAAIDRLLASPHFGERMAVSWMDQARYADTNGYSIDGGRHMWLWRDWVIQSYNQNMPFDQFTVEQLAGDLLPNATESQKIATGFNRNHMITHEGGTIPEENLTNYAADRVKTTSEVFLGLTMACAQCHDHKFDPISQKDYYSFFSFFNELSDKGNDGNAGINAGPSLMAHSVIPDDELSDLERELAALKEELQASTDGFPEWTAEMRERENARGEGFEIHPVEVLDVSSPNRPGPFDVLDDGSIRAHKPSAGNNAFSHSLRLPAGKSIDGVRVRFFPEKVGEARSLTPFPAGVPKVTAVLASAGDQPAKQVDYHSQLVLSQATASSHFEGNRPSGVLDERNLHWWEPDTATDEQHLTVTFADPVDSDTRPYLTVMVFYGLSQSMPFHWKLEAFSGNDTDSRFAGEVSGVLAKAESEWSAEERNIALTTFREFAPQLDSLRIRIANLEERIDVLTKPHPTMVMDTAPKPRETHILDRGQYDAPLEKVVSATPDVLPPLPKSEKATRLDLAHWMVAPEHPLTARVAVNRIWALFFGTGFVATSADFGSQGEWPSHPELLDWLAVGFVENDWNQKELIRMIVSSATYRQDSSATPEQLRLDPKNRLVGRGPRFRLPAEFIRDQALAVSGLLVPRIGGPSVQPYQPAGLWKEVSHFGSTPATKQVFVQDKGEKLYRRSLYTIMKRTSPHPAMMAFDAVNREMCIMQRGTTNTPLQALVTLNDPQFVEAARVFAAKLLGETKGANEDEQLERAFEMITGREPTEAERNAVASYLSDERQRYQSDAAAAESVVSVGESPPAEGLDPVEHAVWTQVSTMLLNLSETLTRS